MRNPKEVIFLFPTLAEMGAIHQGWRQAKVGKLYPFGPGAFYFCAGTGEHLATTIAKHGHEWQEALLLVVGYAGGLNDKLQSGDIVISQTFLAPDHPPQQSDFVISPLLQQKLAANNSCVYYKPSYTSREIVSTPEQKALLAKQGAWVVDMENYWGWQAACKLAIPYLSLRVVLDDAQSVLPDLSHLVSDQGENKLSTTLKHLLLRTEDIQVLIQIWQTTTRIAPVFLNCCQAFQNYFATLPQIEEVT